MKRFLTFIVILTFAALFMTGCEERTKREAAVETDSNDQATGEVNYDYNAPSIYVDFPDGLLATNNSSINLDARCDGEIAVVRLTNKTTGENFEGSFNEDNGICSIKSVILVEGDNVLNAEVQNHEGIKSGRRVIITYNMAAVFLGNLEFSDNITYEDKPKDIAVTVAISENIRADKDSVKLVLYNSETNSYIEQMYLNNTGEKGDSAAGEDIYEGKFSTLGMKEGTYSYRVQIMKDGFTNYSTSVKLYVGPAGTTKMLSDASIIMHEIIKKYFTSLDKKLSKNEKIKYREWVACEIRKYTNVKLAHVAPNGGLTVIFYPEITLGIPTDNFGAAYTTDENLSALSIILQTERGRNSIKPYNELYHKLTDGTNFQYKIENKDENIIWSNKVMNCRVFPFS